MIKLFISGISSDIAFSFVEHLLEREKVVISGTYNTESHQTDKLRGLGCELRKVDFSNPHNVESLICDTDFSSFDALYFLHGTLNPIGAFAEIDMNEFQKCQYTNALSVLSILNKVLLNLKENTKILTLAGGGVNGAPTNFSAYTMSKIFLVKMTELLAAEYPQHQFFNLGPGFVDTKIHQQTLEASDKAGEAYKDTLERYANKKFVPMKKVVECLYYFLTSASSAYSGRNFSAAHDKLELKEFKSFLANDNDAYKLRRRSNDFEPSRRN